MKNDDDTIYYEGNRKVIKLGDSKAATLSDYDKLVKTVEAVFGPVKKFLKSQVRIEKDGLPVWEYRLVLESEEE